MSKELHLYCNSQGIACREGHDLHHSVCCYHCAREEIDRLKDREKKLIDGLEFYGAEFNWSHDGTCIFTDRDLEDYTEVNYGVDSHYPELILVAQIGGKKARDTLKEMGE